jgi:hypothetical protein
MTEFLDTDADQNACEVTGLTAVTEEVIAARRDWLRANMIATLRAMKAFAESSHATGTAQGKAHPGLGCQPGPRPDGAETALEVLREELLDRARQPGPSASANHLDPGE